MRRLSLGLLANALAASVNVVAAQGEHASGTLIDAQGNQVGTVTMEQTTSGVAIQVSAKNLTPGEHGLHVHTVGACEAPAFTSAGGHYNPTSKQHGLQNPRGAHGGDLPNLSADSDGKTFFTATTTRFTVADLADADGSAVVIHAGPDDQMTDPAGNSGDRVACATLTVTQMSGSDKDGLPSALPRTGAGGGDMSLPLVAGVAALLAGATTALGRRR